MSPVAKLNAGTFFCIVCLIVLPNATAFGGGTIRPVDQASINWASSQLTL